MLKNKKYILESLLFYGVAILFFMRNIFFELSEFYVWNLLLIVAIILKDIFFFSADTLTPMKESVLETGWEGFKKLSFMKKIILLNRHRFFPAFLMIYLVIILLKTFSFFTIQDLSFFMTFEYILLGIVVASGIGTVFLEWLDDEILTENFSLRRTKQYLMLSFMLGIFSTGIIFYQTRDLGILSFFIAGISGVLVGLIGLLVIEDEDLDN